MTEKPTEPASRPPVLNMPWPVFYDCEASGLGGLPIEIGWAFLNEKTGTIQSEAHLIKPPLNWHLEAVWDAEAQALHGISIEELMVHGSPPLEIASRMNAILAATELFADDPLDTIWLGKLFEAAGIGPTFNIQSTNAYALMAHVARKAGWTRSYCLAAKRQADQLAPHIHRAEPDARNLATFWQLITAGASQSTKRTLKPRSGNA